MARLSRGLMLGWERKRTVFSVVTVKQQLALELLCSAFLSQAVVRLLMSPVVRNLSGTICYSICWWPLYVLGFSQPGIWVSKRQPGWCFTSSWPSFWSRNILLAYLIGETGETGEGLGSTQWWYGVKVTSKMVLWDGNYCCGHLGKIKSATVVFCPILSCPNR